MSFKNIALILVLGGIGWAVYTGQLDGFIKSLGGTMASTGSAAKHAGE